MSDAGSLSTQDVIDGLARVLQAFLHNPQINEVLVGTDPKLYLQALDALGLKEQWQQQAMKVIPNFEEIIDQETLDEIHAYYEAMDLSETEGPEE